MLAGGVEAQEYGMAQPDRTDLRQPDRTRGEVDLMAADVRKSSTAMRRLPKVIGALMGLGLTGFALSARHNVGPAPNRPPAATSRADLRLLLQAVGLLPLLQPFVSALSRSFAGAR